jgi:hypothetical protein
MQAGSQRVVDHHAQGHTPLACEGAQARVDVGVEIERRTHDCIISIALRRINMRGA